MALVCDLKSDEKPQSENNPSDDVEDGEITDDDEEFVPQESATVQQEPPHPAVVGALPTVPVFVQKPLGSAGGVSDGDVAPSSRERDPNRMDDKDKFLEKDRPMRNREGGRKGMRDRGPREDKHRHMTEAERSILHLRKREKMLREREKREKQRLEVMAEPMDDDFAKNIEKTLATILNKKEKEGGTGVSAGEEPKEEERRMKKRKRDDRDNKDKPKKHKRFESPRSEVDESEMLNVRSGSPGAEARLHPPPPFGIPPPDQKRSVSPSRSEESYNSEFSSDEREERLRRRSMKQRRKQEMRRERKERDQRRMREEQTKAALQDSQGVCVFYLQGKCQKNDCPYSHEVSPPMKLELCKFYLMDCCAKGENCSYMHSEFPCKFYHTGLQCVAGKDCKFAHGRPLSEGLKQILFKHIETAPRDILQGFPRLSRDEALNLINQTQRKLGDQYNGNDKITSPTLSSGGSGFYREERQDAVDAQERAPEGPKEARTRGERHRNKNTRWQQNDDPPGNVYPPKHFYNSDQDMRFLSNGDVDMRTLPTISTASSSTVPEKEDSTDARSFSRDVDIRQSSPFPKNDQDIRQQLPSRSFEKESESKPLKQDSVASFELPQATRDLLARISANQKDNTVGNEPSHTETATEQPQQDAFTGQNINWYSDDDDDDDHRLTIKVEDDDSFKRERNDSVEESKENQSFTEKRENSFLAPSEFSSEPADIVGKLGDLSKIDISAEVTKLLTSMSQTKAQTPDSLASSTAASVAGGVSGVSTTSADTTSAATSPKGGDSPRPGGSPPTDPRLTRPGRSDPRLSDPRQRARQSSIDKKQQEKLSIYEQGGIDMKKAALEIDKEDERNSKSDIDLRSMSLPFKGMQNYTPATEIDASLNAHPPMVWKVDIVEVPRPDYSGLKLSINDAEKTGDPRLRKIFRLSIDDKDSPASPKESPKHIPGARVDPRLKKMEEKMDAKDPAQIIQLSYNQQVNMLQSSQFYQSLTSNQKLMLNQELAKSDQSGGGGLNDPVLNTLLSRLNLLPQPQGPMAQNHMGAAVSILANITKMLPNAHQPMLGQQAAGLLGAAPGIPNMQGAGMTAEFGMNFDPRAGPGGMMGQATQGRPVAGGGYVQYGPVMDQQQQQQSFGNNSYNDEFYGGYEDQGPMGGPQGGGGGGGGGGYRPRGGYNNNNRDGRRRGNRDGFRGGRGGNRNFGKRGGRDKFDRDGRNNRMNRGHSPS